MATLYAPYNPTGATRTGKYGIIRPIPLEPDWHNHMWFERYQMDFVNKNISENNGMISGGSIIGDGVDTITPVGGVAYIAGLEVTVATPGTHEVTADGWTVVSITSAGAFVYGPLVNSSVQNAFPANDAVIVGYAVKGDGVFNVYSFANVIINTEVDGETQHIQPDVTVGPLLSDPRVTDLETTFISSLSAGDKLLFLTGITLTAARDISSVGQVEVMMDGPAIKVDIATYDLTLGDCSGYLGVTSSGGKVILDGLCRNIIIDGNVNIEKGSNFSGNYLTRGIAAGQNAEHKWGTSAQVTAGTSTFYTDVSGNPLDKDAAAVVINDDDKILISHDVPAAANMVLDCGGKKVTIEMLQGVTLDMGTFDLTLGGTGDSFGGDIRVIGTGAGTLTVKFSNGFRVNHTTMLIVNLGGDIIDNNDIGTQRVEFETSKDLITNHLTSNTAGATFSRMSLLDSNFAPKYLNNQNLTWNMPGDLEGAITEEASTDYGCWVDSDGNLALVGDREGVTDGTTAGFLDDSTNDFFTKLVKQGDVVFNLDTKQKTTVKTTATVNGDPLELNGDNFTSGQNYKIIKQSPEGLGENRERLFIVHNNSSSDIDDSWYTQIQEAREYASGGVDFAVTGNNSYIETTAATFMIGYQGPNGKWRAKMHLTGTHASVDDETITISGIVFSARNQPANCVVNASSATKYVHNSKPLANGSNIQTFFNAVMTAETIECDVEFLRKPSFFI